MSEETVTISEEEHARLQDRDHFLCALEAAGVDNWDGVDAQYILEMWNNE